MTFLLVINHYFWGERQPSAAAISRPQHGFVQAGCFAADFASFAGSIRFVNRKSIVSDPKVNLLSDIDFDVSDPNGWCRYVADSLVLAGFSRHRLSLFPSTEVFYKALPVTRTVPDVSVLPQHKAVGVLFNCVVTDAATIYHCLHCATSLHSGHGSGERKAHPRNRDAFRQSRHCWAVCLPPGSSGRACPTCVGRTGSCTRRSRQRKGIRCGVHRLPAGRTRIGYRVPCTLEARSSRKRVHPPLRRDAET